MAGTCYSKAYENNGSFNYFAIGRLVYAKLLDKDQRGREMRSLLRKSLVTLGFCSTWTGEQRWLLGRLMNHSVGKTPCSGLNAS